MFTLQQTPEGNLWKIWESVSGGHAVCVGHVLVYVDDVRQGFITGLKQEWAVATPETVNTETWVRFCGLEFRWDESGRLHVAQPSLYQGSSREASGDYRSVLPDAEV